MSTETAPPVETPAAPVIEDGDVFIVRMSYAFDYLIARYTLFQFVKDFGGVQLIGTQSPSVHREITAERIAAALATGEIDRRPMLWDPATFAPRRIAFVEPFSFGSSNTMVVASVFLVIAEDAIYSGCGPMRYGNLRPSPRVLRVLSHFTVPIDDDGRIRRHDHFLRYAQTLRGRSIPSGLIRAIDTAPTSPITQVMLRNYVKIAVPPGLKTTADIMDWLGQRPIYAPYKAEDCANPPPITAEAQAPSRPQREPHVSVDIEVDVDLEGTVSWRRRDSRRGTIEIPVRVIEEGEEATYAFIRRESESLTGEGQVEEGREEVQQDTRTIDEETVEIDFDITPDHDSIRELAAEQHPELYDEDGDYTG